jgi:hypothetical protein
VVKIATFAKPETVITPCKKPDNQSATATILNKRSIKKQQQWKKIKKKQL